MTPAARAAAMARLREELAQQASEQTPADDASDRARLRFAPRL
jgi:hypothetical protein